MSLHERSESTNRWTNFIDLLPEFNSDETILDYGGNRGNLLYNSNGKILEKNYTSIDISKDCVIEGKKEFPESTFIYFNTYNYMYNHSGNYDEQFPNIKSHDYIFAYSVFSHTDFATLVKCLKWFKTLNPKKIIISYLNTKNEKVNNFFYKKRISEYGSCIDFRDYDKPFFYLVNNNEIIEDKIELRKKDCKHFIALYNTDWLIEELLKYGIESKNVKDTGINFLEI